MTAAAVAPPAADVASAAAASSGKSAASGAPIPGPSSAAADKAKHDAKYDKKKSKGRDKDKEDDDKWSKLTPLERCEKRLRAAKRATRSELSVSGGEWTKHGYADDPDVLSVANLGDDVPRISAREVSVAEFRERFEKPRLPCVITDAMEGWAANEAWTIDNLKARFGDHRFKVGSDDDGYAVRLKFDHIHHYLTDPAHARDDSPLYIFDGSFGDKDGSKPLLDDYAVPAYFKEDLFGIAGEKRRPPYRWVVIGPPRSGSSVHVDPLATSAWNALISGRKRWCLFPPTRGLTKAKLKPKGVGLDGESVTWFQKMYPRARSHAWSGPRPMDCVQHPGEIMYVPDGWWHAVLNLDHTVAVTQNVVGSSRFDKVWRMTRRGRPKMSAQWLAKLREKRPDLASIADAQPRRGESSADEVTSSSSSSSSSEESSDTEDAYDYARDDAAEAKPAVTDETLREMAEERRRRAERKGYAAKREVADKGEEKLAEEKGEEKMAEEKGEEEGDKSPKSPKSPKSAKKASKKASKEPKSPSGSKSSKKRSRDVDMAG